MFCHVSVAHGMKKQLIERSHIKWFLILIPENCLLDLTNALSCLHCAWYEETMNECAVYF